MFLRKKRKIVGGENYEYWNLCESIRTEKGPRQRVVASLCKIDDEEVRQGGWENIDELLSGKKTTPSKQLEIWNQAEQKVKAPLFEKVDVSGDGIEGGADARFWRSLFCDGALEKA